MTDELPTPRTTLAARYVRVLVFCRSCQHQADADLQAIVDAGRGDVPLTHLRFRCSQCGTGNTGFVVTSRDNRHRAGPLPSIARLIHATISGSSGSVSRRSARSSFSRFLLVVATMAGPVRGAALARSRDARLGRYV
ncbi:MAG TPA: hypothetical protein VKI44_01390 [Acetobacteraceae bacterium]|nr:hypothetical protein [Acetobacteraceae bacterium]